LIGLSDLESLFGLIQKAFFGAFAHLGVEIFSVVSGFVIARGFLKEILASGSAASPCFFFPLITY
jgi:peptidoglycan/LPS O-acetylase OafA/YrhL